jgi:hypothetical protein
LHLTHVRCSAGVSVDEAAGCFGDPIK